jgi:hypothetical protein
VGNHGLGIRQVIATDVNPALGIIRLQLHRDEVFLQEGPDISPGESLTVQLPAPTTVLRQDVHDDHLPRGLGPGDGSG